MEAKAPKIEFDPKCPVCRAARGRILITKDAHTCNICWACRANEKAGREVISVLGHICGREKNYGQPSTFLPMGRSNEVNRWLH